MSQQINIMIKIYSKQLDVEEAIPSPDEVCTTEQDWWMIYDAISKQIIIEPQQCSGYTSSPLTIVVADSKEELEQYIADNELIYQHIADSKEELELYIRKNNLVPLA
jgi:hypothetical protein